MANDPGYGFLYPSKSDNPKAPSMSGKVTLPDGQEMDLAGWSKRSKNGAKYLSLKISEPYNAAATDEPKQDDDAPF